MWFGTCDKQISKAVNPEDIKTINFFLVRKTGLSDLEIWQHELGNNETLEQKIFSNLKTGKKPTSSSFLSMREFVCKTWRQKSWLPMANVVSWP